MKTRTYLFTICILLFLCQLYVPASIIIRHEKVYHSGFTSRMLLAPVDPNDPFRGKFIVLSFRENTARVPADFKLNAGETVYVLLKPDNSGFMRVDKLVTKYVETIEPMACVRARLIYVEEETAGRIAHIDYPFTRFYMEESKAAVAEQRYRTAAADSNQLAYGILNIYKEDVVVKDVVINGVSLVDGKEQK